MISFRDKKDTVLTETEQKGQVKEEIVKYIQLYTGINKERLATQKSGAPNFN